MTITCYNSQAITCQIKIDTIHHRAKFVLCCCKDRTINTIRKFRCINGNRRSIIRYRLYSWILISPKDWEIIRAILISNINLHLVEINIKSKWLLWKFFHSIKDSLTVYSEVTFTFTTIKIQSPTHHILTIRRCNR